MNQTDRAHHTLPGSGLLIDGFRFRAPDVRAYVLSHFHSDHYAGLDDGFPWGNERGAKLWCSPVTAALVVHTLGVDPAHVVAVPFDTPTALPGTGVTITLVPANHCPGAAMMLLDTGARRVLHCGDMRFSPAMLANRTLAAARGGGGGGGGSSGSGIDEVLLDTTYAHPRHVFAPQAACIDYIVDVVRAYVQGRPQEAQALPPPQPAPEAAAAITAALQPPPKRRRQDAGSSDAAASSSSSSSSAAAAAAATDVDAAAADLALAPLQTPSPLAGLNPLAHAADAGSDTLFLISAYVVGKERILLALARALRLRVYVPRSKLELVRHLGLLLCDLAWFTDDPTAAAVHVVGMGACGRAWPYFQPAFDGMLRYLVHVNKLHALAASGRLPQAHAARLAAAAANGGPSSSAATAASGDSRRGAVADADEEAAERLLFDGSSSDGDGEDAAASAAAAGADGSPLRYRRVVGVVPTGWVHSSKKKVFVWPWTPGADEAGDGAAGFGGKAGGKARGSSAPPAAAVSAAAAAAAAAGVTAAVHLTPYSEHSSFGELVEFVRYLRPRAVTPTVYADDDDRRKIVERFAHLTDATAAKREFLAKMGGGGGSGGGGKAGGGRPPALAAAPAASSAPSSATASAAAAAPAADAVLLCDDSDEDVAVVSASGGSSRGAAPRSAGSTPSRATGSGSATSPAPQGEWWCHSCARGVAVRFKLGAGAARVAACTRCNSEFVERASGGTKR